MVEKFVFAIGLALFLTLAPTGLRAEPGLAEALFREARADMKAGNLAAACPKLGQSYALVPTPGTLLNWAICEEQRGEAAAAWLKLQQFLALVPADDERVQLAVNHSRALEPALAWLKVDLSPNVAAGAMIWLDGNQLVSTGSNTFLPLRPGAHQLELREATGARQTLTLSLNAKQREEVTLVGAAPQPPREATLVPVVDPAASTPLPRPLVSARRRATDPARPTRRAASVAAAGSIAALVTSLVFGALSLRTKATVSRHCDHGLCDPTGLAAARRGQDYVALADATLVAGGVAGLASVSLFWLAPGARPARPTAAISYTAHF